MLGEKIEINFVFFEGNKSCVNLKQIHPFAGLGENAVLLEHG
jgi:hypothetical protein